MLFARLWAPPQCSSDLHLSHPHTDPTTVTPLERWRHRTRGGYSDLCQGHLAKKQLSMCHVVQSCFSCLQSVIFSDLGLNSKFIFVQGMR